MQKITLKIDGMMCGMCEAHMNDAIRKVFNVEKVTSDHKKGITEIVYKDGAVDESKLEGIVKDTGYDFKGMKKEPYSEKKGLFSFFKK